MQSCLPFPAAAEFLPELQVYITPLDGEEEETSLKTHHEYADLRAPNLPKGAEARLAKLPLRPSRLRTRTQTGTFVLNRFPNRFEKENRRRDAELGFGRQSDEQEGNSHTAVRSASLRLLALLLKSLFRIPALHTHTHTHQRPHLTGCSHWWTLIQLRGLPHYSADGVGNWELWPLSW